MKRDGEVLAVLREEWREKRVRLTLSRQPFRTLQFCGLAICMAVKSAISSALSHPTTVKVILPLILMWLLMELVPGPHSNFISHLDFCVKYVTWWLGLGIVSSVGLGNGLPTGVMFLFPHIIHTCLTAHTCGTTEFGHFEAIWFRSPDTLFKCPDSADGLTPATFLNIWLIVLIPSFIQATGTCIGEIPPYWMARASRLSATEADPFEENKGFPEELEAKSQYSMVNKAKARMISFLRSYGFFGVFLMAAWPNFAFDLCGICCGHFLMPFWTFFGATFLGKGCVRTLYQSLLFTALMSEEHLDTLIQVLQRITPDALHLDKYIHDTLKELKKSTLGENGAIAAGESRKVDSSALKSFMLVWQVFMTIVLIYFVLSCVQHFAQYYQSVLDSEKEKKISAKYLSKLHSDNNSNSSLNHFPAPETVHVSSLQQNPASSLSSMVNVATTPQKRSGASSQQLISSDLSTCEEGFGTPNKSTIAPTAMPSQDNSGSDHDGTISRVLNYFSAVKAYRSMSTKKL